MASAIEIAGREGQHALINGIYEPTDRTHNGRGVWVSRAVRPLYLFHTGKSRWVLSKRIDEGDKCYAFIQDSGNDPLNASGPWTCVDTDNQWRQDAKMSMKGVPASDDKFVMMRMALDEEMDKHNLNDLSFLKQMWKRLDCNGNGLVSLAEVDKLVVDMVAGGSWPAYVNAKPALMRAFKKADLKDGDGDGWIGKGELHALLLNIFWFGKLWQVFDEVDTGDDRQISAAEFTKGMEQLGLKLSEQDAKKLFAEVDNNNDGEIQFIEFCAYARERVCPDADGVRDKDLQIDNWKTGGSRGSSAKSATRKKGAAPQKQQGLQNMDKFNELEAKIKEIVKDQSQLKKLWNMLDFNGNGICSLAEVDKMVVQEFPLLNNKPALMRAFKATCEGGNGDEWVQKKEFKALLANLFYFNKIFWIFEQTDSDGDRRLTEKEFKWMIGMVGANMSEEEASQEFKKIDTNGGGIVLFDEFCAWLTKKACPDALTDMVDMD